MKKVVVLDTCVVTHLVVDKPAPHEAEHRVQVVALRDALIAKGFEIIVPVPVIAEILCIKKLASLQKETQVRLSSAPYATVAFNLRAARFVADLQAESNRLEKEGIIKEAKQLRKIDTFIVACALHVEASALCSFDSDMMALAQYLPKGRKMRVGPPDALLRHLETQGELLPDP